MKRLVLMLVLAAFAGPLLAATRYVSDELSINMRTGKGNQYAITAILDSGTPVETLQSDDDGYAQIRTPSGETGWVLSRFLSSTPSARDRLAEVQATLNELREQNQTLQSRVESLQATNTELERRLATTTSEGANLQSRLDEITTTAANSIQIAEKNEQLQAQMEQMRIEQTRLQYQNQALESRRAGIKIGAVILFIGVLVGLFLPRLRVKRRSAWDSY